MSRTYNTTPSRIRFPVYYNWDMYFEPCEGSRHYALKRRGVLPKLKKHKDHDWHWMSTPSWWTRMMMNRPSRNQARIDCHKAKLELDIEEIDIPDFGKRPHVYYW